MDVFFFVSLLYTTIVRRLLLILLRCTQLRYIETVPPLGATIFPHLPIWVCVCVCCVCVFFLFVYDWLNDIQRNKNIGGIFLLSYSNNLPLICFVSIVHVYDGSMDECMRSIWVYMYKKKKREKIKAEREKEEIYTYSYRVYPRVSHACLIGRLIYRCSFGYWLLRLKGRQKSPFSLFWCCWRDGEPFILQLSTFFCFVLFFKIGFSKVNAERRRRRILFFYFSILIVFE